MSEVLHSAVTQFNTIQVNGVKFCTQCSIQHVNGTHFDVFTSKIFEVYPMI